MSMLEVLCEIRTSSQLKESNKEHQIQLEKPQSKIVEMEAELKKLTNNWTALRIRRRSLRIKMYFKLKSSEWSGFETPEKLEEKDQDREEEEESIYTSAKTSD